MKDDFIQTEFLDTRIKLLIACTLVATSFFITKEIPANVVFILASIILVIAGNILAALKFTIVYIVILFFMHIADHIMNTSLMLMVTTICYVLQKFVIMFMMMLFVHKTTSVSRFICALENAGIPERYIIPLAVALRFIPSIKEDYGALCDSLRVRKIRISFIGFLCNPVRTTEYLLVPILLRSAKTAEELAAAAMVRGVESGIRKTPLYPMRLKGVDWLVAVSALSGLAILFWLQATL